MNHKHSPADWHPFNAVHCDECGKEIAQDGADSGWFAVDGSDD